MLMLHVSKPAKPSTAVKPAVRGKTRHRPRYPARRSFSRGGRLMSTSGEILHRERWALALPESSVRTADQRRRDRSYTFATVSAQMYKTSSMLAAERSRVDSSVVLK